MDLRHEFNDILHLYGHHVLVVRQKRKLRCSCWNEKTREADRECPVCFGHGWVPKIEKQLVRDTVVTVAETLSTITRASSFGDIAVPNHAFFFKHDAQINEKDYIVEVEWKSDEKPVYKNGNIYEVGHIDTPRFENGEITFKKISVKDTPVEKYIRGFRIADRFGIQNFEMIEGESP